MRYGTRALTPWLAGCRTTTAGAGPPTRPMTPRRASSMGHALHSDIFEGNDWRHARVGIASALMQPDLLTVTGLRTMSSEAVPYRPHNYHNGPIWPWDNWYVILGLHRHGYHGTATQLRRRLEHGLAQYGSYAEFWGSSEDSVSYRVSAVVWVENNDEPPRHYWIARHRSRTSRGPSRPSRQCSTWRVVGRKGRRTITSVNSRKIYCGLLPAEVAMLRRALRRAGSDPWRSRRASADPQASPPPRG